MAEIQKAYLLPITPRPNQQIRAQVVVDGENREFRLTFRYREVCGYWTLDIADLSGSEILTNVPLLSGEDLLYPFRHLDLGAIVLADTLNSGKPAANASELGESVLMLWGTGVDG